MVALDVNAGMLEVARSLMPASGRSIEWCEGSALALPFDDGEFQVVLCQLGLQFFPDRPRGDAGDPAGARDEGTRRRKRL